MANDEVRRRKRKPAPTGKRSGTAVKGRPGTDTRRKGGNPAAKRTRRSPAPKRERRPGEEIPKIVYSPAIPISGRKFLLWMSSAVAVVLAMVLAFSIFFKVKTITVSGARQYTPWTVVEASGIREGDNLLSFGEIRAMGKIKAALPYIDVVKISIKLPDTVNIDVVELDVTYAIQSEDGTWWLMSSQGKVVEQTDAAAAAAYTQVIGVKLTAPQPGQQAQVQEKQTSETVPEDGDEAVTMPTPVTNGERLQAAKTILQSLEANGSIGEAKYIDVSSMTGIELQYGENYLVNLGDSDRLPYKIEYMCKAVAQMPSYQTGSLDLSFKRFEEGIFSPGT